LVMPTLGEGGGSFPVEEALICGIPVICSDIPVMREHMERIGAEVTWFDALREDDLAARLVEMRANLSAHSHAAQAQRETLRIRSWQDVADDYLTILKARMKR